MTSYEPPGRFSRERFATFMSPEAIAILMIAILVAGGLISVSASGGGPAAAGATSNPQASAVAVLGTPAPTDPPTPSPSPSPSPTASPTPSPSPSPTPSPTPTPAPTPTPSPTPATWASAARVTLDADERVIQNREDLRAILATNPKTADDLWRLLRSTNLSLQTATSSVDALAAAGAPAALVARLRETHQAALDAGRRTLLTTLTNVSVYKAGAAEVIADLERIEALAVDVSTAAGIADPLPTPGPSPSASASPVAS